MKVLLVEDEDPKLESLQRFLEEQKCAAQVVVARSVKSALAALETETPDLLLLDMSLPTFDISANEPGGRPQGFGGVEILRFLESAEATIPTVIVSGYEAFAREGRNIDLNALAAELTKDYPQLVRGVVYFNQILGAWSGELAEILAECNAKEKANK